MILAEIDRRRRLFACIGMYELLFSVWKLSRIICSDRRGCDKGGLRIKERKSAILGPSFFLADSSIGIDSRGR